MHCNHTLKASCIRSHTYTRTHVFIVVSDVASFTVEKRLLVFHVFCRSIGMASALVRSLYLLRDLFQKFNFKRSQNDDTVRAVIINKVFNLRKITIYSCTLYGNLEWHQVIWVLLGNLSLLFEMQDSTQYQIFLSIPRHK